LYLRRAARLPRATHGQHQAVRATAGEGLEHYQAKPERIQKIARESTKKGARDRIRAKWTCNVQTQRER
jgi:hypothetical protein